MRASRSSSSGRRHVCACKLEQDTTCLHLGMCAEVVVVVKSPILIVHLPYTAVRLHK